MLTDFTQVGTAYSWEDYVYLEGKLLGAAFSTGDVRHFDVDHLGSVRLETDAVGGVVYRDFWPYGEEATPPAGTEQMKFTGHERDLGNPNSSAADLDYMHARYYRPLLGRMLSADPHRGQPDEPRSWNRYTYVGGNPVLHSDPAGLYMCKGEPDKCKRFEQARQDSLTAKYPKEEVTSAAKAFGEPGVDNGITVQFGGVPPGKDAESGFDVVRSAGGKKGDQIVGTLTATVYVGENVKGGTLQAAVAHEGSHILDAQKFAKSIDNEHPDGDPRLNVREDSERRAYKVTSLVADQTNDRVKYDGATFVPHIAPAAYDKEIQGIITRIQQVDKNYFSGPLVRLQ